MKLSAVRLPFSCLDKQYLVLYSQYCISPVCSWLLVGCSVQCHLLYNFFPVASISRLLPSISFFLQMSKFHNIVPPDNVLDYKYLSLLCLNIMRHFPNLYGSPHRPSPRGKVMVLILSLSRQCLGLWLTTFRNLEEMIN